MYKLLPQLGSPSQEKTKPTIILFPTSLQHKLCGLSLFLTLNNDVFPLMSVFGQNIIQVWMWFSRFSVLKEFPQKGEGEGGEFNLATMYLTGLNVFQRDTGAACGKVFLLVEKDAGVWKNTDGRLWKVVETDSDHPAAQPLLRHARPLHTKTECV